jgi:tRNA(Arg) A34 adenosine deaminase TadA
MHSFEEARMNEAAYMQAAIDKAREGIAQDQSPFGAAIFRGGRLICAAHNTVVRDNDPTAHAEINAIRQAAQALQTIALSGCELFTTCEPCPMCLAAIHWAKLDRVVYGASIADATWAGFSELNIPAKQMAQLGGSPVRVENGLLVAECCRLFNEWRQNPKRRTY